MGNNFSKQKTAANQNISSVGAENAIKQSNFFNENGNEQNTEKTDLEFIISSTISSITVTREKIEEFTKKLNWQQEQLQKLETTLADAKAKLASLNSSSGGGTRRKILNKNNRKTRTSCKK
jgi:hypothetical protein